MPHPEALRPIFGCAPILSTAIGANDARVPRTWAANLALFSCLFLAVTPSGHAQLNEIGPAPISPAGARLKIKELLRSVDASNRQQTIATISGLLSWYRDLIDEELSTAWQGDQRANLPEVIERFADPHLASAIIAYSWGPGRQATFVPAYAPMLGHLMARYPDSAKPLLDDLLAPAANGQRPPDLTETEAETVCRILFDMPDNANWRANARQILPHYRAAAETLLAQDLRGNDPGKNAMAQYWMGQLSVPGPAPTQQRGNSPPPSRAAPPSPAKSAGNFAPGNRPTLALNSDSASPQSVAADDALAAAQAAAMSRGTDPPSLLVQQTATRYQVSRTGNNLRTIDVVTADLSRSGDRTTYRNVKLNGSPTDRQPQDLPGSWSSDQFGLVKEILSPATSASFVPRGQETVANRTAWLFDFSVEQAQSSWTIQSEGRAYKPAYSGTLWVDAENNRIVRADMHAIGIPANFPLDKAGESLEFGYREIGARSWLVPVRSVSESCNAGADCNRTVTEFENYRAENPPVIAQGSNGPMLATPAGNPAPVQITNKTPQYSEPGGKLHAAGQVALSMIVDEGGMPGDITVTRSLGYGLDEMAIDAVRQWRFRPATEGGKPVAKTVPVTITFRPGDAIRSDEWYSGPMAFASAPGLTPPIVREGKMPGPVSTASNESVVLGFTVDTAGSVKDVYPISGSQSSSAQLAPYLYTWKFRPATDGGGPAEAAGTVRFVKGQGDGANGAPPPSPLPLRDRQVIANTGGTTGVPVNPVSTQPEPAVNAALDSKPYPISRANYDYSDVAKKLRSSGWVNLSFIVDPNGTARDFTVMQSLGYGLDEKAIESVRKWRFSPGTKDGQPVPARAQVQTYFHLADTDRADLWNSGPLSFVLAEGFTPPAVRDGKMPNSVTGLPNGSVVLGFTVDTAGSVKNIYSVSGSQSSSSELTSYLSTWKFRPAMDSNVPVEATGTVRFFKGQGTPAANLPPSSAPAPINPPGRSTALPGQPVTISSVTFTGGPADPTIRITGQGFSPLPAATSPGDPSAIGYDYGTSLHIKDWTGAQFDLGYDLPPALHSTVGLIISSYSDNLVSFRFGSNWRNYSGRFKLAEGDSFTVYLRDASYSGTVHYVPDSNVAVPNSINPSYAQAGTQPAANNTSSPSQSATGTLRSKAEKNLVLQTASGKFLLFRLLAKTEFRSQDGRPYRDSLVHPGDRVTVDADPDDIETALHVIVIATGSAAEREAASRPVEDSKITAPEAIDFNAARSSVGATPPVVTTPARTSSPPATASRAPMVNPPIVNPKDGLRYVWIPPGAFTIGCSSNDNECQPNEKPPRPERIASGFWLGQTEVTQTAYQRVMGGNPSVHKGDQLPVETVAWNDSANYCAAIGGRLPAEVEWEYAARGHSGITDARYGHIDDIAWHAGNSGGTTHPVAMKQPNAFGLYDMLGNVWEWTKDIYPGADSSILRGGGSGHDSSNARASRRWAVEPSSTGRYRGFRCAMDDGDTKGSGTAGVVTPGLAPGVASIGGPAPATDDIVTGEIFSANGPGVTRPDVISRIDPDYSEEARRNKLSGLVLLLIVVDTEGRARQIRVVKSLGLGLDEQAVKCVKRWKFQPGTKDGRAVNTEAQIEVNFRLL